MFIMSCRFGSTLYGTSHAGSDRDIKGVALPTWDQVATFNVPEQIFKFKTKNVEGEKNGSEDVDCDIISLHRFLQDCISGQTYAFDLIHAPKEFCYRWTPTWQKLVDNREKFYTKDMEAFLGYCMKQAAKYGIKGSRINDCTRVVDWLKQHDKDAKLLEVMDDTFPDGEFIDRDIVGDKDILHIKVCDRLYQYTGKVGYTLDSLEKILKGYGDRAKQAATNQGVDTKAISHAFRAGYQLKELYTEGTMTFPRPEAKFLLDVKLGVFPYADIAPKLEDLIDEVKELANKSSFPQSADKAFWHDFLVNATEMNLVPYGRIVAAKYAEVTKKRYEEMAHGNTLS